MSEAKFEYRISPPIQNAALNDLFAAAWDGGIHAFLLDTTTHPDYQRHGVGLELVGVAVEAARGRGIKWVHVDYEPHLAEFYSKCGFGYTEAGLMGLE